MDKYNELLEKAKKEYFASDANHKLLENLFPELKELKDGKTKQDLIEFVKSRLSSFPDCDRYIAWIEKQKPVNHWKPTEQQLESLLFACNGVIGFEDPDILSTLYDDLVKL